VALLKHGANANTVLARYAVAATPDDDATNELCSALSIAAERGKHSLVNLLLKHGGDPRLLPASYKICDTETVD
jgi:ankyrin repeat protein